MEYKFKSKIIKIEKYGKIFEVVETPLVVFERKKIYIPQLTRYWILDKSLHKAISRLEEKGYIRKFCNEITKDDNLFKYFKDLHELEIEERKRIYNTNYSHLNISYLTKSILDKNIGIGGIGNFREKPFKVKCLHLWTAYHLVDKRFENPIGKSVLENIYLSKFYNLRI